MYTYQDYQKSADFVRGRIGDRHPKVLLILGSGLGGLADMAEDAVRVVYQDIPNFKCSTAPGHSGELICGTVAGVETLIMCGRMHYYEGYGFEDVTYPIRVASLLGAKTMIVTNAAGGINESFRAGDIMLIQDHIKLLGDSPLRGANIDELGVRFPDMTYVYTPRLREIARRSAEEAGVPIQEGVYMYTLGPQYETPAEIRAIRTMGADAVGMSTAPEAICAAHLGMDVLGFSLISNMASGILDKPLTCEEVMEAGEEAKGRFSALILKCLENVG